MNKEHYVDLKNSKDRDRFYNKFTDEQVVLFNSVRDNIFTYVEAKAGTGKTATTVASLIDMLANDEIDRIVYIQKVSRRFLQSGFLPGSIEEKTQDLWTPFYDAMLTLGFNSYDVGWLIEQGKIILCTDCALRGVNFEKAGVVVDESENTDFHTLKLIFTRCHDNCHVVMLGDYRQKDNTGDNMDFTKYGEYLANSKIGNRCVLTHNFRGKFSMLAEDFSMNN